jgi:hypothetical protein
MADKPAFWKIGAPPEGLQRGPRSRFGHARAQRSITIW